MEMKDSGALCVCSTWVGEAWALWCAVNTPKDPDFLILLFLLDWIMH